MKAIRPRVGYAELERMPDDGHRYELYDGDVVMVPAPIPRHQRVVHDILKALDAYAASYGGEALISPIDIVFSEYDVLQPDIVFFQASRLHVIDPDRAIRSAPDLAIEVLSPSTQDRDRGKKMQTYARYGVHEYWLVDPVARRVEAYRRDGDAFVLAQSASGDDTLRSTVLPDLAVHLGTIVPPLTPRSSEF